jgi:hypothetical protein
MYIIHGENIVKSRQKLGNLLDQAKSDNNQVEAYLLKK